MQANEQRFLSFLDATISSLTDTALDLLEKAARRVMRENPDVTGFCMAMGSATFYDSEGEPLDESAEEFAPFYDLLDKCENGLGILRGYPMKIEGASGPKLTDW